MYDASASSAQSEDTVYSADSIEFSPVQQDVFVCGTYQIQKAKQDKASKDLQTRSVPNGKSGEASNEDDSSDDSVNPAPKTTRLGRALVYRVAEDGQSLYVIPLSFEGDLLPESNDGVNLG